jgi:hypothetical protein
MKSTVITGAALLLSAAGACAAPHVGDAYQVTLTRVSSKEGGYSSSSTDTDAVVERVVEVRADGVELEYDLSKATPVEIRAATWQFPARVFKPFDGPARLLNGPEIEARVERWLKSAGLSRAMCGHWIFTWNAFRVECDPQSVLKTVAAFDLSSTDMRDGALYRDAEALGPATLKRKDGSAFTAELPVDPDAVRRARAEADVVVGEITHKSVTIDAALRGRAKESVSGTISVEFETDAEGDACRRTKVTRLDIDGPKGRETETVTETLERKRAP